MHQTRNATENLDSRVAAPVGSGTPIRLGALAPFSVTTLPLESERLEWLMKRWGERTTTLEQLSSGLLAFGGHFAILQETDRSAEIILSRGQLWGQTDEIIPGPPSRCHENCCELWEVQQGRLVLATGYALSEDGLWRQHSWCVRPTAQGGKVVETTEPRLAYFGYVLTLSETVEFALYNREAGVGVRVKPATETFYAALEAGLAPLEQSAPAVRRGLRA